MCEQLHFSTLLCLSGSVTLDWDEASALVCIAFTLAVISVHTEGRDMAAKSGNLIVFAMRP